MAEVLIPPDIIPDEEEIELVDDGTVPFRPELGRSMEQVQQNYEPRLRVTQRFRNLRLEDRARMIAALRLAEGKFNTVRAQIGRRFRGNMTATELLTNNTFASGTTGWTSTIGTQAVADRTLRNTLGANISTSSDIVRTSSAAAVTQYAALALRYFFGNRQLTANGAIVLRDGGSVAMVAASAYATPEGLKTLTYVPTATSLYTGTNFQSTSGTKAGDFIDVPYVSLARCLQIDNGQNLLLQSDNFTTSWANSRSTDAANSAVAPDGTTTADSIIEDATAANTHYITQSVTVASAAADYCFGVALKLGTRTFARISMSDGTHEAYIDINLTTGAIGTATVSGANWSNPRATVSSLGNGWYGLHIVARKTTSATTIFAGIYLATALGTITYSGDGASLIYAWRGTLAQSSVPTRLVQTTTTATTGTSQTGSALYVKGGPVSTSNAIAMDGLVEVNGEALQLTASLDFDAAGLGYLQFKPSLFRSPADSDPVIAFAPLPRLKIKEAIRYDNKFGLYSDFELVMEQHYE